MIRVYLINYYDVEKDEMPEGTDMSYGYRFYGYDTLFYRSVIDITDTVLSTSIDSIDFYERKEPSKAQLELVMNDSIYGYSLASTDTLSAMAINNQMLFNNNTFRLGSLITIVDDSIDRGGRELIKKEERPAGEVTTFKRNDNGSFSASGTEWVEASTVVMPDDIIWRDSHRVFSGRITEFNNDHQRIQITVTNCMYEYRNSYREFYNVLTKYKQYDPKTDTQNTGLRATAGDIVKIATQFVTNVAVTNVAGGGIKNNAFDTDLIYDDKYEFLVPISAVLNKSLMEIIQWGLQQYWKIFLVKNQLTIRRDNRNDLLDDIYIITSNNTDEITEKLAYSYPIIRFDYNYEQNFTTPVAVTPLIISTFYEINHTTEKVEVGNSNYISESKSDSTSIIEVGGYKVTLLTPDNIISYKYGRSTKNIVNEFNMLGTKKDDKNNVSIVESKLYPFDSSDASMEILKNSRIKYGVHRLTRTIDLIDNTVSLETFAKDIGSILAEPDYSLSVNIINIGNIQLNDAVMLDLTGHDGKVYEVKNINYKYSEGSSEATLELRPVLVSYNTNQKTGTVENESSITKAMNLYGVKK